jgi:gamma-glutamylcyclotransferase (GGCT)/AIG2-like uncharacterized protein YtfP
MNDWQNPEIRLISYGTLRPGEANHRLVAGLRGACWKRGYVEGVLQLGGCYPRLQLRSPGRRIPVQVLESPELPKHWKRLDKFEGRRYRRVVATVYVGGLPRVGYVYESVGPG